MAAVNSLSAAVTAVDRASLGAFRAEVAEWVGGFAPAYADPEGDAADFAVRAGSMRRLQRAVFDAGWLRWGWPVELGGLGGDARHRAILYDELGRAGLALRGPAEHLEIMAGPLVRHWAGLDAPTFTAFLKGEQWWCQGFSEPDSGSDLVSLRTRATRDGDAYRLTGRKLWTSWANHAARCLVLARTGPLETRHRGLSAFFVDLDTPGIVVRPIRQANGSEELADVTFDDVIVPADRLVGAEGDGFSIALDVLGCERSSFAWLRHAVLYARVDELCARSVAVSDEQLGALLVDLFALRAAAAEQIENLASGRFPGPGAAVVKVLLTRAEQHLYDSAYGELGGALALGSSPDIAAWQEEYLFSRAVSIYGGTKQVQLTTVARFLLGLPTDGRS